MEYVAVLLPSACLAVIFYFVIKAIFNADRAEREAMARAEEMQDAEDARNRDAAREKNDDQEIDPGYKCPSLTSIEQWPILISGGIDIEEPIRRALWRRR